jgi:acetyl esterase/lipase
MKPLKLLSVLLLAVVLKTQAQEFIPLWPKDKKPNFNGIVVTDTIYNERIWRVGNPGIYVFRVNKDENKGSAILICPGGGYERLSYLYNGFNFAKWFNTLGINVFVLINRLPHQADLKQRDIAPLQDAQRAMRIIRSNAAMWGIQKNKIGVMGVSAGGHVASSLGIHEDDVSSIGDAMDTLSFRPDFMVLLSPVITMGKFAHAGSKKNLLGLNPSAISIEKNSNELQVTASTPPTFMVHALNDSTVNIQNSLLFYAALLEKKINASLHIFPLGGHGIKIKDNPGSTELWLPLLELWLGEKGFTDPIKK